MEVGCNGFRPGKAESSHLGIPIECEDDVVVHLLDLGHPKSERLALKDKVDPIFGIRDLITSVDSGQEQYSANGATFVVEPQPFSESPGSSQTSSDFLSPTPKAPPQKSSQRDAIGVSNTCGDVVNARVSRLQKMDGPFHTQILEIR
jgi:hypothetical protein